MREAVFSTHALYHHSTRTLAATRGQLLRGTINAVCIAPVPPVSFAGQSLDIIKHKDLPTLIRRQEMQCSSPEPNETPWCPTTTTHLVAGAAMGEQLLRRTKNAVNVLRPCELHRPPEDDPIMDQYYMPINNVSCDSLNPEWGMNS